MIGTLPDRVLMMSERRTDDERAHLGDSVLQNEKNTAAQPYVEYYVSKKQRSEAYFSTKDRDKRLNDQWQRPPWLTLSAVPRAGGGVQGATAYYPSQDGRRTCQLVALPSEKRSGTRMT